jgi:hypothetical protein
MVVILGSGTPTLTQTKAITIYIHLFHNIELKLI